MLHSGRYFRGLSFVGILGVAGACSHADVAAESFAGPSLELAPGAERIEESDLYRVDGSRLYVHSAKSGLNVIDVSAPLQPRLLHQLPLSGRAGELYVEGERAFVLVEEASPPCRLGTEFRSNLIATTSQLVGVENVANAPEIGEPACMPGKIVASRKINDIVYVITSYDMLELTWVFAIDVAAPLRPSVRDSIVMEGVGREVHVTEDAIYVAQSEPSAVGRLTRIRQVSIASAMGRLEERGSVEIDGEPAGRFHMDVQGDLLRIVTRGSFWEGSFLHIIDFTNPDRPVVTGGIGGIAPNEDLHATRFDGDRAYVVTYEPVIRQTDPLWVISLSDPTEPEILAELEIPGWSDYIFPRGDQLVAVGRGDRGGQVAVSLFDVVDPAAPAELSRIAFGDPAATSEANADFRAATLVEGEQSTLVVVPFTDNVWQTEACVPEHHVQLVELGATSLTLRGESSAHRGPVLRTVPIGEQLYALGEREAAALDISNRDAPRIAAAVEIATSTEPDQCSFAQGGLAFDIDTRLVDDDVHCAFAPIDRERAPRALIAACVLFGLTWMVRRRSSRRGA
jgi:uncharacterized secreted protein with C-terminal beta-propeller domain